MEGRGPVIVQALAFYVFAIIAVASAIMVVAARNPVHSVLFLILAFFNGAGLFVLIGAEFLAMVLVVVYVGAVAVLFLFVVMMLDINFVRLREGFIHYLPIGALIGLVLLVELVAVATGLIPVGQIKGVVAESIAAKTGITNTEMLGQVIYTKYIYLFQLAGMVLFVAMVGAIVLTLRHREGVRRQKIARQVARRREDSVELKKVTPGEGV
jgi:NADH-quinone oxidoreductase subunit J